MDVSVNIKFEGTGPVRIHRFMYGFLRFQLNMNGPFSEMGSFCDFGRSIVCDSLRLDNLTWNRACQQITDCDRGLIKFWAEILTIEFIHDLSWSLSLTNWLKQSGKYLFISPYLVDQRSSNVFRYFEIIAKLPFPNF